MKNYPLIEYFPMGGPTKEGEYNRTIQLLKKQTGASNRDLMLALYLMADCGYNNKDLYEMAKLIQNKEERRKNTINKEVLGMNEYEKQAIDFCDKWGN